MGWPSGGGRRDAQVIASRVAGLGGATVRKDDRRAAGFAARGRPAAKSPSGYSRISRMVPARQSASMGVVRTSKDLPDGSQPDLGPRHAGGRGPACAFVDRADGAAFAELVARHGPLVPGLPPVLADAPDAEDAFQATFLILARKAATVRRPERLGAWLYGVALRCAFRVRKVARRAKEQPMPDVPAPARRHPHWADVRGILDAEIGRLSEKSLGPLSCANSSAWTGPPPPPASGCRSAPSPAACRGPKTCSETAGPAGDFPVAGRRSG